MLPVIKSLSNVLNSKCHNQHESEGIEDLFWEQLMDPYNAGLYMAFDHILYLGKVFWISL